MSLFQQSVFDQHLTLQDSLLLDRQYEIYCRYFHNQTVQQNIRESKEEQFQEGFLRELFVSVLGYTIQPSVDYNLTTEFKNQRGARKADGAILDTNKNAIGVIELKGTKTKDLEQVRQQAFDYKANQAHCVYIITSNFEKLRFYIENAVDYIEFDLFTLRRDEFTQLYLCLSAENTLNNIPLQIKKESLQQELNITKKLYKEYSEFKVLLFNDLIDNNLEKNDSLFAAIGGSIEPTELKKLLYKKSQKLIDRFLFIFFAEDRALLPPNTIIKLIQEWKKLSELDAYSPLYERMMKYFNYLDTGRKGTAQLPEIFAYNGGLYKPDAILDCLIISDDVLTTHLLHFSQYDFNTQVDVNILGHIFENSISDIEAAHADMDDTLEPQVSKRKQDGIFYTPDYVTKFLVEQTLRPLCFEQKQMLGVVEKEYRPNRQAKTKKALYEQIQLYRDWLLNLKILDPACGSGAFLNQALSFLIKEHHYIDELESKLMGGGFVFNNIENHILENNIYGVDINEESIEISKLSLWLRTAEPRRKLNDLSNNIKIGNSLIESADIAPNNNFVWREEFKDIFDRGGFDVIIGNPPWGAKFTDKESEYVKTNHRNVIVRMTDSFMYFIDLCIELTSDNGYLSLVVPDVFLYQKDNKLLRERLLREMQLTAVINMGDGVFENIARPSCVFAAKKTTDLSSEINTFVGNFNVRYHADLYSTPLEKVKSNVFATIPDSLIPTRELTSYTLLARLQEISKLSDFVDDDGIARGVSPDLKEAFIADEQTIAANRLERQVIHNTITGGRDMKPYFIKPTDKQIFYVTKETPTETIPRIIEYITSYAERITCKEVAQGKHPMHTLHRPRSEHIFTKSEKIVGVITGDSIITAVDADLIYPTDGLYIFAPNDGTSCKAMSTLLNTYLVTYLYRLLSAETGRTMSQVKPVILAQLPFIEIPEVSSQELESIYKALNSFQSDKHNQQKKVERYIAAAYQLDEIGILKDWPSLDLINFFKEINKHLKRKGKPLLSLNDKMDWEEFLVTNKGSIAERDKDISALKEKAEDIACRLFGLTEQEIESVYRGH
jgi:type I restriction-modification system DNA methylase subunit